MNRLYYKYVFLGLLILWLSPEPATAFFFGKKKKQAPPTNDTPAVVEQNEIKEETAGVRFNNAYQILLNADQSLDNNNLEEALRLYREAWFIYINLSKQYPDWQPGLMKFRLIYCDNQIESLLKRGVKSSDVSGAPAAQLPPSADEDKQPRQIPTPAPPVSTPDTLPESKNALETTTEINQSKLNEIAAESRNLIKSGNMPKARELLVKGISISPDNKTFRLLLGIVHCKQNEFENAMYLLTPLVEENPSDAYAHMTLGTAYFGLGRITEALKEMESAVKLNPNLGEAHFNLAQIQLANTRPNIESARSHYKKALELGSKPDENLNFLLKEKN